MKKLLTVLAVVVAVLGIILITVMDLGARSGVTSAQVQETLPGDEIIPHPWISIDRAATMPASASTTWPWVAQLGNSRGGWYAPLWLENAIHEHAASSTLPQFQNLTVGEVVPDWGGGSLKVLAVDPGNYVVYGSIHERTGSIAAAEEMQYAFTWALVLENDTPSSTSFHLRLRLAQPVGSGFAKYIPPSLPGFFDYATDVVMFAGLKDRLDGSYFSK
jgi:hypothetical protein